ncbi:hypothetical protein F4780DRAFT_377937 [Xylariomycetidae sp. FL0641]|nr:hypothetical protein F4780DRAFT_377937 [Xylariomycetidae sp. FL0641]
MHGLRHTSSTRSRYRERRPTSPPPPALPPLRLQHQLQHQQHQQHGEEPPRRQPRHHGRPTHGRSKSRSEPPPPPPPYTLPRGRPALVDRIPPLGQYGNHAATSPPGYCTPISSSRSSSSSASPSPSDELPAYDDEEARVRRFGTPLIDRIPDGYGRAPTEADSSGRGRDSEWVPERDRPRRGPSLVERIASRERLLQRAAGARPHHHHQGLGAGRRGVPSLRC